MRSRSAWGICGHRLRSQGPQKAALTATESNVIAVQKPRLLVNTVPDQLQRIGVAEFAEAGMSTVVVVKAVTG